MVLDWLTTILTDQRTNTHTHTHKALGMLQLLLGYGNISSHLTEQVLYFVPHEGAKQTRHKY